jgi:Rha family phage regulatory protein
LNELQQKTITSLEVAEMVDKPHNELLKDIRRYTEQLGEGKIAQSDFFTESTYINSQNKEQPCYLVTKKGCEFIGNKLTGTKGAVFTAKYIEKFHDMEETIQSGILEGLSDEMKALLMHDKKIQIIMQHVNETDSRVIKLENNMTIDYGQQLVLKERTNSIVIHWLGGKESNAYHEMAKKVFSECNKDFQKYFNVNSRNNTPKLKFEDAVFLSSTLGAMHEYEIRDYELQCSDEFIRRTSW